MAQKDFNLKVTVRNAHILRAIRQTHESVSAFCRDLGLPYTQLNGLICMRITPHNQDGKLRTVAEDLCSAVGMSASELWPKDMARLKAKRATTEIELSQAEALAITGDPDKLLIQRQEIQRLSQFITERQAHILSMRYDEGLTYKEIAKKHGVTVERIRQLEKKAIKTMRGKAKFLQIKGDVL